MATTWHMSVKPKDGKKAEVAAWAEKMGDLHESIHQLPDIERMSKDSHTPNRIGLSFEGIYAWFDGIQNRQRNDKAKSMISEEREKVREHLDAMQSFQLKCAYTNSGGYKIEIEDVSDSASVRTRSSISSGDIINWKMILARFLDSGKITLSIRAGDCPVRKAVHKLPFSDLGSGEQAKPVAFSFGQLEAWFEQIRTFQEEYRKDVAGILEVQYVEDALRESTSMEFQCIYSVRMGYTIFSGSMWRIDVLSISDSKVDMVVKGMSDSPVPRKYHLLEKIDDLQSMDTKPLKMSVDQFTKWLDKLQDSKDSIPRVQAKLGERLDKARGLIQGDHPFSMVCTFTSSLGYSCVVKEAEGHEQAPSVEKAGEEYISSYPVWSMKVKPPPSHNKSWDVKVKIERRTDGKKYTSVLSPLDDFQDAIGILKLPPRYMEGTSEVLFQRMFADGKMTREKYAKIKKLLERKRPFEIFCYTPAEDKYAFRVEELEAAPSVVVSQMEPGPSTEEMNRHGTDTTEDQDSAKGSPHQSEDRLAKLAEHNRTLKEEKEKLSKQLVALAKRIKESKDVSSELQEAQKQVKQLKAEKETLAESLRQVEDSEELQEKLDQVQSEVNTLYQQWRDRYQENKGLMKEYTPAVRDLGFDEDVSIPGMNDAEGINGRIGKLHQSLSAMNPQTFAHKSWDVFVEYQKIQRAMDTLSIPWDSALVNLFKHLPEDIRTDNIPSLDKIPPSLEAFVATRGFELIWPERGDELSLSEHRILDELKDDEVGRRKVIRAVAPGLRQNNDVTVKAAIYLAK